MYFSIELQLARERNSKKSDCKNLLHGRLRRQLQAFAYLGRLSRFANVCLVCTYITTLEELRVEEKVRVFYWLGPPRPEKTLRNIQYIYLSTL